MKELVLINFSDVTGRLKSKLDEYVQEHDSYAVPCGYLIETDYSADLVQRDLALLIDEMDEEDQLFIVKIRSNLDIRGKFDRQFYQWLHAPKT